MKAKPLSNDPGSKRYAYRVNKEENRKELKHVKIDESSLVEVIRLIFLRKDFIDKELTPILFGSPARISRFTRRDGLD